MIKMTGDGSGTVRGGWRQADHPNRQPRGGWGFRSELCTGLGVTELSPPLTSYDMEEFRNVLVKVDEHNAVRLRLAAEVADSSNAVKRL